jgi:predicted dehydrogenase
MVSFQAMGSARVIVVGAGGISNAWFGPLRAEAVEVAAVVDLNLDNARRQIAKYELHSTTASNDLDQILRDVPADFVLDLTVPDAHCGVTCKALKAGLHVIGEKPMAASMAAARQMIAASQASGRMFMVSQSRRWDTNHATLARSLREGVVGEPTATYCDFFIGPHFGGFREEMAHVLLLDMAIHHFDLARMFTGRNARRVWCHENNPRGSWYKGSPVATCVFEMDGGVQFVYCGHWAAEGLPTSWNGDWRFIGTRGSIRYDGETAPVARVVPAHPPKTLVHEGIAAEVAPVVVEATGMHGALREMLTFLRTGRTPQTECSDNIHSLAMVHGAIESSRLGAWVDL